jgi:predicted dehydrogenase
LKNLYLVGGGRWARVVLSEVLKLSDKELNITVVSEKNHLFMQEWIRKTFVNKKIIVLDKLPQTFARNSFLYVLNETALRYETLLKVLKFNIPVLVEKPLGLTYSEVDNVINLYETKKVPLLSAQVFRFLESISELKKIISEFEFQSIVAYWSDPQFEFRLGEDKKYERVVPTFLDVLPHILSLLEEIIGDFGVSFESIFFNEIENDFMLYLRIDRSIELRINYSRVDLARVRQLEFSSQSGLVNYDFAENETITQFEEDLRLLKIDFGKSKPLQHMLIKFLSCWENRDIDAKFSHNTNKLALKISQDIQKSIKAQS